MSVGDSCSSKDPQRSPAEEEPRAGSEEVRGSGTHSWLSRVTRPADSTRPAPRPPPRHREIFKLLLRWRVAGGLDRWRPRTKEARSGETRPSPGSPCAPIPKPTEKNRVVNGNTKTFSQARPESAGPSRAAGFKGVPDPHLFVSATRREGGYLAISPGNLSQDLAPQLRSSPQSSGRQRARPGRDPPIPLIPLRSTRGYPGPLPSWSPPHPLSQLQTGDLRSL